MFYLLFILTLWGCAQKKAVVNEPPPPPPQWVKQKPVEGAYYSGIGMAVKNSVDYQAIAKNNALNDLASEISVQINSTSILYQVEQNEQFREEFKANTRLKSIENIEGFELVATHENEREYWVYYRLSKIEYQSLKKAKKESAIAKAQDLYQRAIAFKNNRQYDDALVYGIKSLEAIKNYLGEGIKVEKEGKDVYLDNELFGFINETVNEIKIKPLLGNFSIIRGRTAPVEQLSFMVSNEDYSPLADVPVYFYYSGGRLKNRELYTDNNGIVAYPLPKITSENAMEYLQANLNMVSLTKEATDDPIVSQLVGKISGSEARIKLTIKKPSVFIKSEEMNFGEPMKATPLSSAFKKRISCVRISNYGETRRCRLLLGNKFKHR